MGSDKQRKEDADEDLASRNSQSDPERELELRLKKHPEDLDAKADVGSDESMDASDPSSVTLPGSGDPAPSSSYPE